MRKLLEGDLPLYYKVGRRCVCPEEITTGVVFDLIDADTNFIVSRGIGDASFLNSKEELISVIKYDRYIELFDGTKVSDGKRKCDFVLNDDRGSSIVLFCEITSYFGNIENLSAPIRNKKGIVVFPNGKYEKVEIQLYESAQNLINVPTIKAYIEGKQNRICLMVYKNTQEINSTIRAFNRNITTEATEAGDNGAEIPSPAIESLGFRYFRMSADYTFKLN